MKLFLIICVIISTSRSFVDAMHGGRNGTIEQVPHMAELYKKFEDGRLSFCGAAILSERWILTAAHCVKKEENSAFRKVRVKTNTSLGKEGVFHNISEIILHKKYSTDNRWKSDVALIKLTEPIKFDEKSHPIPISKKSPRVGDVVAISGYGDDYQAYGEVLKVGQQTIISKRACKKIYEKAGQGNVTIDGRVFCTNSTNLDLCGGDSGSPGVMNGKLVGIAADGCEAPLPNIYVNVAHYYGWIVKVTGIKFD